jgi:hypothetical protein
VRAVGGGGRYATATNGTGSCEAQDSVNRALDDALVVPDDVVAAQRIARRIEQEDRAAATLPPVVVPSLTARPVAVLPVATPPMAVPPVAVAIARWPDEAAIVARLRAESRPHLLLIGARTPPVEAVDLFEDWARLPVSVGDLRIRLIGLCHVAWSHPRLDGYGRLLHRGRWIALSPLQERLAGPLVHHLAEVVTLPTLAAAGWPGDPPPTTVLRGAIRRLRTCLEPLGLEITTVRRIGYLLRPM